MEKGSKEKSEKHPINRKNRKKILERIIKCRISYLLNLSIKLYDVDSSLSCAYVKNAFNLVKRYKVKLEEDKWLFCRKCFVPWIVGKTLELSEEPKFEVYTCKKCGYVRRRYKKL